MKLAVHDAWKVRYKIGAVANGLYSPDDCRMLRILVFASTQIGSHSSSVRDTISTTSHVSRHDSTLQLHVISLSSILYHFSFRALVGAFSN